jgi:hypothetical protein
MSNAISSFRNVKIAFDNAAGAIDGSEVSQVGAPLDAFKAAIGLANEVESKYAKLGAAGVPDLTAASILVTGHLPFQIHVFTLTTVMATGSYQFIYVETKPNTEA